MRSGADREGAGLEIAVHDVDRVEEGDDRDDRKGQPHRVHQLRRVLGGVIIDVMEEEEEEE